MTDEPHISYQATQRTAPDGRTEVCLLRLRTSGRHGLHHGERVQDGTLYSRRFRHLELMEIADHFGRLERVAEALTKGELGCWIRRSTHGGEFDLQLYEHSFDGREFSTTLLREEHIDASDEDAVERAASVLAEMQAKADELNAQLQESLQTMIDQESAARAAEDEQVRQATELKSILDGIKPAPS